MNAKKVSSSMKWETLARFTLIMSAGSLAMNGGVSFELTIAISMWVWLMSPWMTSGKPSEDLQPKGDGLYHCDLCDSVMCRKYEVNREGCSTLYCLRCDDFTDPKLSQAEEIL